MLKGNKCSTFFALIMMIVASELVGCTDVVPQISILHSELDGSNKIVFDQFVPGQNPSNNYSEKFVTAYGSGYSSYKVTAIPSMQSCNSVDFTKISEVPSGKSSFAPSADGSYVFCAIGKVSATAKWQEASQAVTSAILEVDTVAPEANSFTINSQLQYTRTLPVDLNLESTGAKQMYITQDSACDVGGSWESFASTKSWTLQSPNALNHIYVKFRDAALNESACITQQIIHDDIAPALVKIDSPADNSVFNANSNPSVTLSFTCEASSQIQISGAVSSNMICDSSGHSTFGFPLSTLAEGANEIRFKALDAAGNESPISAVNYFKDTIAPAVGTFTAPAPNSYANASTYKNFSFSGTCEPGATIIFDSREFPCSSGAWQTTVDLTPLPDGVYTFSFTQRDTAGNISPPASIALTKDIVAPSIPGITSSSGSYINLNNQAHFTISGTCTSGNTVKIVSILGESLVPCSANAFSKTWDFTGQAEGDTNFYFYQIDPAGNISSSLPSTYVRDVTAPVVTLAGTPASPSGADPLTVTVSGPTDLGTYEYKVGSQGSTDCGSMADYSAAIAKSTAITSAISGLADGFLTLCVVGIDNAGNIQTAATSASWIKDTAISYLKIVERERTFDTGSGAQSFTLSLSTTKLYPTTVYLSTSGDATYSVDHNLTANFSVVIPAGQNSVALPFNILNNTGAAPGYSSLRVKIATTSRTLVALDNLSQSVVYIKYAGTLPTASMVSVGGLHTCAILSSGKLKCWGDNSSGQIGDGTTVLKSIPTAVDASSIYTYVSAGSTHTCAIRSGQMVCWGSNSSSELGFSGGNTSTPTVTDVGISYSQVSAGTSSTCGITTSSTLRCWGVNANYRLGVISVGTLAPTTIGSGYSYVSLGINHACGLLTDGTLNCWGNNDNGQMGDGTLISRTTPAVSDSGVKYNTISVGSTHTCGVVKTSGVLKCWGANNSGQLGQGDTTSRTMPTIVNSGTSFSKVWTGTNHTCALSTAGQISCWGSNTEGQLLIGTNVTTYSPSSVDASVAYATGAANSNTTCGITSTGILKCGGSNSSSQVGDTTLTNKRTPASNGVAGAAKVAVGYGHSCVLVAGRVSCSGYNGFGQIGDGTLTNRLAMTPIDPTTDYNTVAANYYHSCAITSGNQLKCWGRNDFGQIGDGTTVNKLAPTLIDSSVSYTAVAVGTYHTCALTSSGVIKCWGKNAYSQLGNNSTTNASTPQIIDSGVFYSRISAHDSHTCGITTANVLKCWGDQSYGKQGDGITSGSKAVPTVVDSGVSYTFVTTGYDSTCAITTSGVLKCFGFNSFGQIGNGTTTNATTPVVIDSGVTYARVIMGHYHTCGITVSGVAKCWGWNDSAQVGNNTIAYQTSPQVIDSGVSYSEVALGYNHTCGVTTNGDAKCWGNNNYGQYGDGGIPSHWRLPLNIMKWLVP